MSEQDHPSVRRVRDHARGRGLDIAVRRYPETTRTAQDAARAIGCDVAQIVKSLAFVADGQTVVVLVSGADRVDEEALRGTLGAASLRRATAAEVRERTGFVVGGVPPFGHAAPVLIDTALLAQSEVWAAAGLPDAVFPIAPAELLRLADARAVSVRGRAL